MFSYLNVSNNSRLKVYETEYTADTQRSAFQRQLVCRKFRNILQRHPGVLSSVVLREHFPAHLLPNLLEWTRLRRAPIRSLIATCSASQLDIVLASFIGQQAALRSAACQDCSDCSFHLLSMFSGLKMLTLRVWSADLTPLGQLALYAALSFMEALIPPQSCPQSCESVCSSNPHVVFSLQTVVWKGCSSLLSGTQGDSCMH